MLCREFISRATLAYSQENSYLQWFGGNFASLYCAEIYFNVCLKGAVDLRSTPNKKDLYHALITLFAQCMQTFLEVFITGYTCLWGHIFFWANSVDEYYSQLTGNNRLHITAQLISGDIILILCLFNACNDVAALCSARRNDEWQIKCWTLTVNVASGKLLQPCTRLKVQEACCRTSVPSLFTASAACRALFSRSLWQKRG